MYVCKFCNVWFLEIIRKNSLAYSAKERSILSHQQLFQNIGYWITRTSSSFLRSHCKCRSCTLQFLCFSFCSPNWPVQFIPSLLDYHSYWMLPTEQIARETFISERMLDGMYLVTILLAPLVIQDGLSRHIAPWYRSPNKDTFWKQCLPENCVCGW